MKRIILISFVTVGLLLPMALSAGGTQEEAAAEEAVVTFFAGSKYYSDNTTIVRNEVFEKESGLKVEMQLVAGDETDFYDKTDIAIMAGDTTICPMNSRSTRSTTTR